MAKYTGRTSNISSSNVPESPAGTPKEQSFGIAVRDFNMEDMTGYVDSEQTSGNLFKYQASILERVWAEGGWGADIQVDGFGYILRMLCGHAGVMTAATASDPTIHNFRFAMDENHDPYTIYEKHAVQDRLWSYFKLNTLNISQSLENIISYTLTAMARRSANATNINKLNTDTSTRFISPEWQTKLANNKAGLGDAKAIKTTDFSMDINKNVSNEYTSARADKSPDDILNKEIDITGSFTLHFESLDQKDIVFSGTSQAMSIRASNGVANAGERFVESILTNTALFNFERVWSSNDALMQTIQFKLIDDGKAVPDVIEFNIGNDKTTPYA